MSNTKSTLASLAELVVPVLATVFSFYYLYTIQDIPFLAQMYGGGISFFLVFLCLVVTLRVVVRIVRSRGEAEPATFGEIIQAGRYYSKAIALVLGMALYIGLMPYLGYPLLSFLFVAGATYILGVKSIPRSLLISLAVTVAGYVLFIVFLQVRLPIGPLRYLGL